MTDMMNTCPDCDEDLDEAGNCPACHVDPDLAYWRQLYEGERQAGLLGNGPEDAIREAGRGHLLERARAS